MQKRRPKEFETIESTEEANDIYRQIRPRFKRLKSRQDLAELFELSIEHYRAGGGELQNMKEYLNGAAAVTRVRNSMGQARRGITDPGDGEPDWRMIAHIINAAFAHS